MIHEECGVFGIYDRNMVSDVVSDTYYGLFAFSIEDVFNLSWMMI